MKIVTSNNKNILHINHEEWLRIGSQAGWIKTARKSPKKAILLKKEKNNALEFIEKIQKELKNRNHEVSKIKEIRGGKVGIQLVDGHRVDIEVKPWASQNNKNFDWKSGIRVTVGSGLDKFFRRKIISRNIDKICNYVEKIVSLYNKKEDQRLRRNEVAEQKREEKIEQAKLEKNIKEAGRRKTEEQAIKEDIDINRDIREELYKKKMSEREWIDLFANGSDEDQNFLNNYLLNKRRPFSFGSRSFFFYDPHSDYNHMPINDVNSISEIEQLTGLSFVSTLRKRNFIRFLYDVDYGLINPSRKDKFVWLMEEPIAKSQGKKAIEWGTSSSKDDIPDAVKKHLEREQMAYEILRRQDFEEHKKQYHEEERKEIEKQHQKEEEMQPHQLQKLLQQVASSNKQPNIALITDVIFTV